MPPAVVSPQAPRTPDEHREHLEDLVAATIATIILRELDAEDTAIAQQRAKRRTA